MRGWVALGLCVLAAACSKDDGSPRPPVATGVCAQGSRTTGSTVGWPLRALGPDGREAVLVRYREGGGQGPVASVQQPLSAGDAQQRARAFPGLRAVALRVTPEERSALEADPGVELVETDRPVYALGGPARLTASGLLGQLPPATPAPVAAGSVGEYTPGLELVQAPAVWDPDRNGRLDTPNAPTGQGIRVCVVDSGIDPRHPELQVPVVGQRNFVLPLEAGRSIDDASDRDGDVWGGGHGTHVAATIAAQLGSAGAVDPADPRMDPNGVVGVAPGAGLLIARVLNTEGVGSTSAVIDALRWCRALGAHVVSLSLGSADPSRIEEAEFDNAAAAGLLAVAATGNDGTSEPLGFPAGYDSVLAVGAVGPGPQLADFSQNFCPRAGAEDLQEGLMAPGVDVLSAAIVGGSTQVRSLEVAGVAGPPEANPLAFASPGTFSGPLLDCGLAQADGGSCPEGRPDGGFVAYVDRGLTTFAEKVSLVQAQGARAVIIGNNEPDGGVGNFTLALPVPPGLPPGTPWAPAASVDFAAGQAIKAQAGAASATLSLSSVDYRFEVGTSMAVPHVSGVAALVWSARPILTGAQVRQVLEESALDLGEPGWDPETGWGLVQARSALDRLPSLFPP